MSIWLSLNQVGKVTRLIGQGGGKENAPTKNFRINDPDREFLGVDPCDDPRGNLMQCRLLI
jgi:hypothetical protein